MAGLRGVNLPELMSDAEINDEINLIATEYRVVEGMIARLGQPHEGESHVVVAERDRLFRRLDMIGDRGGQLAGERTKRFMKRIDATDAARQLQADGDRPRLVVPGWELGPRRRS